MKKIFPRMDREAVCATFTLNFRESIPSSFWETDKITKLGKVSVPTWLLDGLDTDVAF